MSQRASVNELAVDPIVSALRDEIAALDVSLIGTVNARIKLVEKLHRYKAHHGIPVLDPSREAWLLEYLKGQNPGPLSDEGLAELFAFVLALVKREAVARD